MAVCGDTDISGALIPFVHVDRNTINAITDEMTAEVVVVPRRNLEMFLDAYEDAKAAWNGIYVASIVPANGVFDVLPQVFEQAKDMSFPIEPPPNLYLYLLSFPLHHPPQQPTTSPL